MGDWGDCFCTEPLSIIAADDPVTCAVYAKENDLLALDGCSPCKSNQAK